MQKSNKQIPQLAKNKECTGCLACYDSCPKNAISYDIEKDGHYYVRIDKNSCIQCKKCELVCPIIQKINYSQSECSTFYAAWGKNSFLRKNSASGGVFTAIAEYILDLNGIVFGAIIDKTKIKHTYITSKSQLSLLQGSKYVQSDISTNYRKAYSFLKEGKTVLFSGTGCQIAALYSFISNKKTTGKLITVDLICGGVPSQLLQQKFIQHESFYTSEIVSYRTKEEGWRSKGFCYNLKIKDTNNFIHNYKNRRNLITDGFSSELTNRYSCYNCQFVGRYRMSDYTIGDLWGDKQFPEEHYNGVSLLICHNYNAENLLKSLKEYLIFHSTDVESAIKNNPRIVNGKNNKKYMLERIFLKEIFERFSYKTLTKIYAYNFPTYSIWIIYKLYRYIINIILKRL